jgi:hypothetical protein
MKENITAAKSIDFSIKKEANETSHWLLLLFKGDYISETVFNEHNGNCLELVRLSASIVKTTKAHLDR